MISEQAIRDAIGEAFRAGLITLGAADYLFQKLGVKP